MSTKLNRIDLKLGGEPYQTILGGYLLDGYQRHIMEELFSLFLVVWISFVCYQRISMPYVYYSMSYLNTSTL